MKEHTYTNTLHRERRRIQNEGEKRGRDEGENRIRLYVRLRNWMYNLNSRIKPVLSHLS